MDEEATTLDVILNQLPPELHEVARAISTRFRLPVSLSAVDIVGGDIVAEKKRDFTGLEVVPNPAMNKGHGVVVLSIDNSWYIAVLGDDLSSAGGWERDKADTSVDDVVEMVEHVLTADAKS